ncbi:MAG: hypothetical protein ACLRX5_10260 [Slackia sp.]
MKDGDEAAAWLASLRRRCADYEGGFLKESPTTAGIQARTAKEGQ